MCVNCCLAGLRLHNHPQLYLKGWKITQNAAPVSAGAAFHFVEDLGFED